MFLYRWGEERDYNGNTHKYWVSSSAPIIVSTRTGNLKVGCELYNLFKKQCSSIDCCQLMGQELGWRWLLSHCTRKKRMWNWSICDWRVGPDNHGGHAQPSPSPRKTQIEMPNRVRLWSSCLLLRSLCTLSPDWTNKHKRKTQSGLWQKTAIWFLLKPSNFYWIYYSHQCW